MRALLSSGVLVSALLIAGCSSSSNSVTPTATSANVMPVSIVSGSRLLTTDAYSPNPVTVPRGSTVTWTNNDSIAHTSTSDSGAWSSGTMAPGATFSMTFPTAGSFPYRCTIHPNMVGTVNVQ